MKVLVACEFSGTVRDAFARRGHDAWSCDLLPTEKPGNHIQGDVLAVLNDGWDLMVAHPPCTHLSVSGARWFTSGHKPYSLRESALLFVKALMDAPIDKICVENPISVISSRIRKPDQIVHPYFWGDPSTKSTCLWLKGLPKLSRGNVVTPETVTTKSGRSYDKWWYESSLVPLKDRGHFRSKTFPGIAEAMAEQWGSL